MATVTDSSRWTETRHHPRHALEGLPQLTWFDATGNAPQELVHIPYSRTLRQVKAAVLAVHACRLRGAKSSKLGTHRFIDAAVRRHLCLLRNASASSCSERGIATNHL